MDQLLSQLSASLTAAESLEQLVRPLLEMLGAVTGMESTYLTSIDENESLQHIRFARNIGEMTIPEGLSVPWSDTLCKRALESGQMFTSDVAACWGDSDAARALGIQTYISTPVRSGDGVLMGTLCAASAGKHDLAPSAETMLRLFSTLVAHFIERELLVEELRDANRKLSQSAMTDPLTGLPNRRALFNELDRLLVNSRKNGSCIIVAVVDLDNFKQINDNYGHVVGDLFLQEIARRIQRGVRSSGMLARIGGDEFAIVGQGPLLGSNSSEDPEITAGEANQLVSTLAERVSAEVSGTYLLAQTQLVYKGASIGAVALNPEKLEADEAIHLADMKMYVMKRRRKEQH